MFFSTYSCPVCYQNFISKCGHKAFIIFLNATWSPFHFPKQRSVLSVTCVLLLFLEDQHHTQIRPDPALSKYAGDELPAPLVVNMRSSTSSPNAQ